MNAIDATPAITCHDPRRPLISVLGTFEQFPIMSEVWGALGDVLARLRAAGVTIPFPDAMIIEVGVAHDIEVWTRDKHFEDAQDLIPNLRLLQPQ
jgi:predicted nucleic acid-binding protein